MHVHKKSKGIKTKMETTVGLYGKGNEIISYCLLYVGLCLVLNGNYHNMYYCRRNMLHQICTSQISNDNIHQSTKTIFGDNNIHLSLCVAGEKVKNLCTGVPFFDTIVATVS